MDTTITLRISKENKDKLQEVANQEDRKLSALCRLILEKYIKEYKIDVSNRR